MDVPDRLLVGGRGCGRHRAREFVWGGGRLYWTDCQDMGGAVVRLATRRPVCARARCLHRRHPDRDRRRHAARLGWSSTAEYMTVSMPTIKYVRAFILRGGGADYHDQSAGHWIDDHIATPMSKYEDYRQSRQSFGLNVLGTLVVEIEASDGTVGFSVTTGGELGCWIVEKQDRKSTRLNSSHSQISYA